MPRPQASTGHLDAQRLGHLGAEDARPAQLEPAQRGVPDVHLDRRLGEGEEAGHVLDLRGARHLLGEHLQQAEQRAEVHLLAQHDALGLVEVGEVRGVHLVVAEAAHHAEVLARDLRRGELLRREHRALAAQDEPAREVAGRRGSSQPRLPVVQPFSWAAATWSSQRLLDRPGVGGLLHVVDVVDVAGGVELGHEQRVAVPELGLDQRPVELLEAERAQLVLQPLEELAVGVLPSHEHPGGRHVDVVAAEGRALPGAGAQHLRGECPGLLAASPRAARGPPGPRRPRR